MAAAARPHTKLGQRDFRKIYPNVWRRDCFYGTVYPPKPQPMNKAKMRNVLERNKLEEDQMLILLLLPPPQRRPPQQHVATAALRQASHTTMSLNWRSSPSSSVLLLLPLFVTRSTPPVYYE
jgi:hypothetical protein